MYVATRLPENIDYLFAKISSMELVNNILIHSVSLCFLSSVIISLYRVSYRVSVVTPGVLKLCDTGTPPK
jgi:hypothetical protein